MAERMFESLDLKESRPLVLLRRAALAFLALCSVTALASGHRAYFQVRGLELRVDTPALRAGSVVETEVVSSGRTHVDVRVELVQGSHAETLAVQSVRGNEWGSIDPRTQRASQRVLLTPEVLSRFEAGAAVLRATATGRPQWMRLPPPTVRETAVEIR
ncbi:MAG TPA: hypothetical protein VGP08_18850 [Pyrinomonadaceae bacterium]|jgi:hypothetical protein|nr:hypothetical protein [Pyrinomonadaceae bacterium]